MHLDNVVHVIMLTISSSHLKIMVITYVSKSLNHYIELE